jgi:hypothetical protein
MDQEEKELLEAILAELKKANSRLSMLVQYGPH